MNAIRITQRMRLGQAQLDSKYKWASYMILGTIFSIEPENEWTGKLSYSCLSTMWFVFLFLVNKRIGKYVIIINKIYWH